MRLQKFLAECGVASRRKSEEYIEQGLVTVNGEKIEGKLILDSILKAENDIVIEM